LQAFHSSGEKKGKGPRLFLLWRPLWREGKGKKKTIIFGTPEKKGEKGGGCVLFFVSPSCTKRGGRKRKEKGKKLNQRFLLREGGRAPWNSFHPASPFKEERGKEGKKKGGGGENISFKKRGGKGFKGSEYMPHCLRRGGRRKKGGKGKTAVASISAGLGQGRVEFVVVEKKKKRERGGEKGKATHAVQLSCYKSKGLVLKGRTFTIPLIAVQRKGGKRN